MIVTDLIDLRSSLTGIYSGLFHSPASHAFVTGGDMPFLKKDLVALIMEYLEPGWDVVVPVTAAGYQPLAAVYSRRCLPVMARQLARKRCKVSAIFSEVRVKEVPETRLREVDPELVSFFNINTPADLDGLPPQPSP
jgi:molybdopterin-guanine dinucleotide biosynthesis protein A